MHNKQAPLNGIRYLGWLQLLVWVNLVVQIASAIIVIWSIKCTEMTRAAQQTSSVHVRSSYMYLQWILIRISRLSPTCSCFQGQWDNHRIPGSSSLWWWFAAWAVRYSSTCCWWKCLNCWKRWTGMCKHDTNDIWLPYCSKQVVEEL